MFWLVDMRLHFHFAASNLFLGLGHSDYNVQVRQNGMPKIKEMQVKLSWSVFVKACFVFMEIVKN